MAAVPDVLECGHRRFEMIGGLSLACDIMITYASFLHRKSDLNNNAAIVSIAD